MEVSIFSCAISCKRIYSGNGAWNCNSFYKIMYYRPGKCFQFAWSLLHACMYLFIQIIRIKFISIPQRLSLQAFHSFSLRSVFAKLYPVYSIHLGGFLNLTQPSVLVLGIFNFDLTLLLQWWSWKVCHPGAHFPRPPHPL